MAGVPPVKGEAFSFTIPGLVSQADTDIFQTNPTLAPGDVKVFKDGVSGGNIGTLPTAIDAGTELRITLSAAEMTADDILVSFKDVAGDEWQSEGVLIFTDTAQMGEVATAIAALNDPTAGAIADQVWDETLADHLGVGSTGEGLNAAGGGVTPAAIATAVWTHTPRTPTTSAASVASALEGSTITILRGDTLSVTITGLGSIADRDKLWLTMKNDQNDADSAAVIQIEETAGLIYLNGAAATASDGSLVVDNQDDGDITFTLKPAASVDLVKRSVFYDVQVLRVTTGVVNTLTEAEAVVTLDTTRATT